MPVLSENEALMVMLPEVSALPLAGLIMTIVGGMRSTASKIGERTPGPSTLTTRLSPWDLIIERFPDTSQFEKA